MGMRFALLESKMALATVMRNFNFVKCEKTVDVIVQDPVKVLGANKEGLWIRAEARN